MESYSLFVFLQCIDVLDIKLFLILMFQLYLVYANAEGMLVCWFDFFFFLPSVIARRVIQYNHAKREHDQNPAAILVILTEQA